MQHFPEKHNNSITNLLMWLFTQVWVKYETWVILLRSFNMLTTIDVNAYYVRSKHLLRSK